jgi:transglutaminase-like putative cysteine protease
MKYKGNILTPLFCAALCLACSAVPARGQQKGAPLARPLKFSDERVTLPFVFRRSAPGDPYLTRLREEYALDSLVAGRKSEYEKVRAVSRWVRSRWEHNGSNMPEKPDPISILEEAKQGKRFRCVEYSAVLAGALNAVGIPARVVSLLTEDVETRESGAAHVVAEAYLADRKKWVMVDGQWDVIPTLKGRPLGAVEFQRALARRAKGLGVDTFSGVKADGYFEWVAPYLFYFITKFDGRYGVAAARKELVLVPVGAKEPKVVQRKWPIGDVVYTHSLRAFNAPGR